MSISQQEIAGNTNGFNIYAPVPAKELERLGNLCLTLLDRIDKIDQKINAEEKPMEGKNAVMGFLNISEATFYNWMNDKKNPIPCHAKGGKKYFYESELNDWIRKKIT